MDSKAGKAFSFSASKKSSSSGNISVKTLPEGRGLLSRLSSFSVKSSPTTPAGSPPPSPTKHLKEQQLNEDIAAVHKALDYFLNSNISEAEAILKPRYEDSMYYSLGYSFILYLKCVMTFQHDDINNTLNVLKHTIALAAHERKKDGGWLDNITSWVKGTTLEDVKQMTVVERHAELVYSEAYLLKALLSILYDESVMSFLRESLNIRSSYSSYMTLEKYVDYVKSEGKDEELDPNFTSGVALGVGCFSLILSMLPSSVVKVAEFIGFSSDRAHGLQVLEAVGGWDKVHTSTTVSSAMEAKTGLRRPLSEMVLILYHIVLSKMIPLSDVDISFGETILNDCLSRYPRGVFFLYFNGRLMVSKRLLGRAEEEYQRAIDTQKDWKQLQHMCFWELGIIYIMQQKWQKAYDLYTILSKESNWSKAVYIYLKAINLYMLANETSDETIKANYMKKVVSYMEQVTEKKKKIAGKSIPMEKFVARKARKFKSQGNYLLLPDLEILNAFAAFDFMPVDILNNTMERINVELNRLLSLDQEKLPTNYYDDACLAQFLRSITARMLFEQGQDIKTMHQIHEQSLNFVFDNADNILLDHYIFYFSHYERALMLILDKNYTQAEADVQLILKSNERNHYGVGSGPHAKNKYSLASSLVFKCHNCMTQIKLLK
ncbi:hypothetical protein INT47_003533 [Mucor saturninus]|uniref:Tetratricopeptide repeat protein 39B n=1 Tax=Mucor saturninus TaxID=64648 RepID=A0A8H7QS90_9FUNG|nr:hypothetical protein INT47_003533 [Mucor saturninus]